MSDKNGKHTPDGILIGRHAWSSPYGIEYRRRDHFSMYSWRYQWRSIREMCNYVWQTVMIAYGLIVQAVDNLKGHSDE